MKGLFSEGCKARNNEEYCLVLHKRKKRMWLVFWVSLITAIVACVLEFGIGIADGADYYVGFGLGLGGSMAAAALGEIYRANKLLADENRLKEERLKETDEREIEVNSLALKNAARIVLVLLYVILTVAALLYYPEFVILSFGLIMIFIISFALLKRYYAKKL